MPLALSVAGEPPLPAPEALHPNAAPSKKAAKIVIGVNETQERPVMHSRSRSTANCGSFFWDRSIL
jgi:hypothetical protein